MSTKRGKRRKQDKSTDGIQQQQQQHTQQSVTRSPSLTGDDPSQHQQLQSEQQQRRVGTVPQSPPHSDETFTPNTQTRTHDSSNAFDPLQEVIMNDAAESDLNKFFMFDYQGTDFDINSTLLGNPMLAPTPSSSNNFQADATTSSDTFHNDGEDMLGLVSELPSPFSTSLDSFQPACPISPPMTSSSSIPHDRGDMTAPASETSEHSHGSRSNSLGSASRQSWPSPLSVLIKIIGDLEEGVSSSGSLRFDDRLTLNRKAMAELSAIIGKDSFKTCRSCIVLVASALDLILENYGYIVDSIISEGAQREVAAIRWDHGRRASTFEVTCGSSTSRFTQDSRGNYQDADQSRSGCSHASASKLRMGCYELDQEDQTLLRNHVICKELRRCVEVAGICVGLSQSKDGRSMSNHTRVRATLKADTQASAYRLVSILENRKH